MNALLVLQQLQDSSWHLNTGSRQSDLSFFGIFLKWKQKNCCCQRNVWNLAACDTRHEGITWHLSPRLRRQVALSTHTVLCGKPSCEMCKTVKTTVLDNPWTYPCLSMAWSGHVDSWIFAKIMFTLRFFFKVHNHYRIILFGSGKLVLLT